jgi:AcrR family transcriptional regulator
MARPRTTSDDAILAATARVLAKSGPGRLTLATVADEAGLSPATLLQRFGSKRGLLLALVSRAEDGVRRPFEQARRHTASPTAALHAALADLSSSVRTPEELANSLSFLQIDLTDPEFGRHAAAHARAMREEITAVLEEAVSAGELPQTIDVGRLAAAVQVTYNGTLIISALEGEGSLAERMRSEVDYLLRRVS